MEVGTRKGFLFLAFAEGVSRSCKSYGPAGIKCRRSASEEMSSPKFLRSQYSEILS